jgi:hypothetical protein
MTNSSCKRVNIDDQGQALALDVGKATLAVFDEKQARTVDQIEVGCQISGQNRFA